MSIYPSLEDLKIDQLSQAQRHLESKYVNHASHPQQPNLYPSLTLSELPAHTTYSTSYPSLSPVTNSGLPYPVAHPYPMQPYAHKPNQQEIIYPNLSEYMGLELTPAVIAANMPEYMGEVAVQPPKTVSLTQNNMVAPISNLTPGLQKAQVTNGIRELILCKDANGRVGLRVAAIDNGIFVCLVFKDSPAAMAGVRFGDQVLQINGQVVAGYSMDQVHKLFKKSAVNGISVIIRDRPYERTVTLLKDSVGQIGFQFKNGEINRLVKDSSATRNGVLTNHYLLEVDGQNVVGLKDKEIRDIITQAPSSVTITVIPTFVYNHIMKKMADKLVKSSMDHSVPSL